MRRSVFAGLAAGALLLAATGARAGFYDVTESELRGEPGSIIRFEVKNLAPPGATVFRILYRSGQAVARQVPGAGLGLTITLAILKAHDGTIDVVKSDETGTTFRMTLPLLPSI